MNEPYAPARWPLVVALGALWLTAGALLAVSLRQNQGHLVYALDDPYISMAMAKNLAGHGVWGVTRYEFTSSSSSLLWPLLLAAIYRVFGANEIAPLLLNLLAASGVVWLAARILEVRRLSPASLCASLLAVVAVTPLVPLIFTGLEHSTHLLLTVAVVFLAAREMERETHGSHAGPSGLLLPALTVLLSMIRYESLFLIGVMVVLFAARGRWRRSLILLGAGLVPVAIYGAISIRKGWYFLPNPILRKGTLSDLVASLRASPFPSVPFTKALAGLFGEQAYQALLAAPHVMALLIVALTIYAIRSRRAVPFWESGQIMALVFVATTLLHMQLARTGWFYRYEAYLVGTGLVVCSLGEALVDMVRPRSGGLPRAAQVAVFALAMLAGLPLLERAVGSHVRVARCTRNIYEQQYQMGLFLKDHYAGETVMAHDIGAMNFLADIHCVEVVGLANMDVIRARLTGGAREPTARDLSPRSGIAILYDHWIQEHGGMPPGWVKAGSWTISGNIIADSDTVSFYAIDRASLAALIRNLREFSGRLPPGVAQTGPYVLQAFGERGRSGSVALGARQEEAIVPRPAHAPCRQAEAVPCVEAETSEQGG